MGFVLKKEVKLDQFGWEGCSIQLKAVSFNEAQEWQKKYSDLDPKDPKNLALVLGLLKERFISGKALDEEGNKVDIKLDELGDLPVEIVTQTIKELSGTTQDPNL